MPNTRRQFLKLLGLSPALPAIGWLPKEAEKPAPPAEPTAEDIYEAVHQVVRDALLAEESRLVSRRLQPTVLSAMRGYDFFDDTFDRTPPTKG